MTDDDTAATPDRELLSRLRSMLADADPVPREVVAAARDSYGWRSIDAQLAALVADSLLDTAPVRGSSERLLSYEVGDSIVEVEVTDTGGRLRIVGQLTPSRPARVRADQPSGSVEVLADRFGRFTIEGLTPGPTRFVCVPVGADDATQVQTDWTVF